MTNTITLRAGGDRNVKVTAEEGAAIAARFQQHINDNPDATVDTVDLSGRCWNRAALEPLEDVLTSIANQVTTLQLDDIIASLDTDAGLDSLAWIATVFGNSTSVTSVNLDDNALGTRGDQVLLPLFSLTTLQQLSLENCGMSREVAASLLNSLQNKANLTLLSMGRNQIGAEGAAQVGTILGQCPNLQVLRYNGARPLSQGTADLLTGLAQAQAHLVEWNVHDGTVKPPSDAMQGVWDNLAAILNNSPGMQVLNLRDTEIGHEGLEQVLEAVRKHHMPITHLSLGGCEMGEDGVEMLAKAAEEGLLASLELLNWDTNELGDDGIATLIPALAQHCPRLTSLDLEGNELGEGAVDALCDNRMPALTALNLAENMDLDDEDLNGRLKAVYPFCKVDGDEDREEAQGEVQELADAMAGAHL